MTRSEGPTGVRTPAQRTRVERGLLDRLGDLSAEWAPTAARGMLALVLAWFGYHELVQPSLWTGYVRVVPDS